MNIQKIATVIAITTGLGLMNITTAQANPSQSRYSSYGDGSYNVQNNRRNQSLRHNIRDNRRANKTMRHEIRDNRGTNNLARHQANESRRVNSQLGHNNQRTRQYGNYNRGFGNRYKTKKHQSNFSIRFSSNRGHNNRYTY